MRALAALAEDPVGFLAPTPCSNSNFRGSDALFWTLQASAHMWP